MTDAADLQNSLGEQTNDLGDSITCHECGQSVARNHRFCGHCGASLIQSTAASKQWLLSLLDAEGEIESSAAVIPGTQIIGSSPEADIRIEGDRAVSPRHVMVRLRDGELSLEDKGTRNGLFAPLDSSQTINHNALIRAGGQLFRFQLIDWQRLWLGKVR